VARRLRSPRRRHLRHARFPTVAGAPTPARARCRSNGDTTDLARDPFETHDLASESPELADELERQFEHWEDGLVPPSWPPAMEYRFTIGGRTFVFPL
jgi:hypothetical protein